ncbi:MAG: septum site-determining protein MinC [Kofleriaceae bacterium]
MESTNTALAELEEAAPAAVMRGTARGLEWNVDGRASAAAVVRVLEAKLAEAPAFFRGSDVRITVEAGPLSGGCLLQLVELSTRFELRIVEVGAPRPALPPALIVETSPVAVELAEGSAPTPVDDPLLELVPDDDDDGIVVEAPTQIAIPAAPVAPTPAASVAPVALPAMPADTTRLFVGPVRSGVILDHTGNLIVFGDVNPGAEVRATGNIVVLGRLKGTAHAAIGSDTGFILALRLEPQQLRIGRRVARAADNDTSSNDAEIAYATGDQMIVERYKGLPRNLATAI